jgi:hypothetical protein
VACLAVSPGAGLTRSRTNARMEQLQRSFSSGDTSVLLTYSAKDWIFAAMDHKDVEVALADEEKALTPESAETMKLELSENPPESTEETVLNYLIGWRLHVLTFT